MKVRKGAGEGARGREEANHNGNLGNRTPCQLREYLSASVTDY